MDRTSADLCDENLITKAITISSFVVAIPDNFFRDGVLEKIVFAFDSKLRTIGKCAFKNCKFLKSIRIPASVVEIADDAFYGSALEEVIFTNDSQLKTIGQRAFGNCKFLKSIAIPDNVTHIGDYLFCESALEQVIFGDNSKCEIIPQHMFSNCNFLKSIKIPASILQIAKCAFGNSGLEEITFANDSKLKNIGEGAFYKCILNKQVKIPTTIVEISGAFRNSALQEVMFMEPSRLQMIGPHAFSNCTLLKCIQIPASVAIISYAAFSESTLEKIIFAEKGRLRTIGKYSFRYCTFLKSLTLPKSLTGISHHAFSNCKLLKSVRIPSISVKIEGDVFFNSGVNKITFADSKKYQIRDVNYQFKDFMMDTPQNRIYSLMEEILPSIMKKNTYFKLLVKGGFTIFNGITFPETVLSYLAYIQAFDAFKYVIENVPRATYTPTHLVACSLFRGYGVVKGNDNIDSSGFMKLFEYILQDNRRPLILGVDKEWIGKSIFTCLRYGSPSMCMKLFSYGFDTKDILIEAFTTEFHNSLARYSLLSYACKYQSVAVVKYLIDAGVCLDGLLEDPTIASNRDGDACNENKEEDEDDDAYEGEYDNDDGDEDDEDNEDDDDEDDEDDEDENANEDETNPENYIFSSASISRKAWFEPYFNRYRLNKNQDVEIFWDQVTRPFNPAKDNPLDHFEARAPYDGLLALLNMTPLSIATRYRRLDIVKLLLTRGANSNSNTLSGFPHLFVYCAKEIIEYHCEHEVEIKQWKVDYPFIPSTLILDKVENDDNNNANKANMDEKHENVETKIEMEAEHIEPRMKRQKLHSQDGNNFADYTDEEYRKYSPSTNDIFGSTPSIRDEVAIIKELINYGADLLYNKEVIMHQSSREFNIYDLCACLDYSIDLFEYLQTLPVLKDKIIKYYTDSFRLKMLDFSYNRRNYHVSSLNTVDYLFQKRYLTLELFEGDQALLDALKKKATKYPDLKSILEKHKFQFEA